MSFRIESEKYEEAYAHFMRDIRNAIQITYAEEANHGLTQVKISEELGVDPSVVSRRLNGSGNVTLRTVCDLYTAFGREPLSNFETPPSRAICLLSVEAKLATANRGPRVFVSFSQPSVVLHTSVQSVPSAEHIIPKFMQQDTEYGDTNIIKIESCIVQQNIPSSEI